MRAKRDNAHSLVIPTSLSICMIPHQIPDSFMSKLLQLAPIYIGPLLIDISSYFIWTGRIWLRQEVKKVS